MSEPIQSIANGTYMIGETTNLNFEAGPGISITKPSEGTVRIANDETVIFSTDTPPSSGDINLSESMFNFERIGVSFVNDENDVIYQEFPCVSGKDIVLLSAEFHMESSSVCLYMKWGSFEANATGTALVCQRGGYVNIYGTNKGSNTNYTWTKPYKIVGINRKENAQGGNT